MINHVCTYFNRKHDYIVITYDDVIDLVMIVNTDTKELITYSDMHDAKGSMLDYIADDFDLFLEVDKSVFELTNDDIEAIKNAKCFDDLIRDCKDWSIKMGV